MEATLTSSSLLAIGASAISALVGTVTMGIFFFSNAVSFFALDTLCMDASEEIAFSTTNETAGSRGDEFNKFKGVTVDERSTCSFF